MGTARHRIRRNRRYLEHLEPGALPEGVRSALEETRAALITSRSPENLRELERAFEKLVEAGGNV